MYLKVGNIVRVKPWNELEYHYGISKTHWDLAANSVCEINRFDGDYAYIKHRNSTISSFVWPAKALEFISDTWGIKVGDKVHSNVDVEGFVTEVCSNGFSWTITKTQPGCVACGTTIRVPHADIFDCFKQVGPYIIPEKDTIILYNPNVDVDKDEIYQYDFWGD